MDNGGRLGGTVHAECLCQSVILQFFIIILFWTFFIMWYIYVYNVVSTGALFPGVKGPESEADHLPPCSAKVKNGGAISLLPHMLGPDLSFNIIIFFCTDGRTPWTGNQPIARPLPTQDKTKQNKRTHRHPCLEWDSNPRSQRSNERPKTVHALDRAATVAGSDSFTFYISWWRSGYRTSLVIKSSRVWSQNLNSS
jgi:hypothetical protein